MFTVLIFFYALDGHFLCSTSFISDKSLRDTIEIARITAKALHHKTYKQIFITEQTINKQVYYTSNFARK